MKFNMNNFPKFPLLVADPTLNENLIVSYHRKVREWFEGFEAELQERILKCGWTECKIIKEILGE